MRNRVRSGIALLGVLVWTCAVDIAAAQTPAEPIRSAEVFLGTPAVSGYEQEFARMIRDRLQNFSPINDNVGNLYVTFGSGSPHRLIVTPMDEPGYVVSEITADGYLRVQRLPQRAPNAVFDLLHAAQPIWVMTRSQKNIAGVFSGLSVHLEPGRQNPPTMGHPDEMFVDIGATNRAEVLAAGVKVLDPIALARVPQQLGPNEIAAPAAGDHFGCLVLTHLLQMLAAHEKDLTGTLTVAFVTQQWTGGRGLDRLLNEVHPDEMIYVGRLITPRTESVGSPAPSRKAADLGTGVLLGTIDPNGGLSGVAAELKKLADENHLPANAAPTAVPRIAGYAKPTPFPQRFAQIGIPSLFPVTPAETISGADLDALEKLLYWHVLKSDPPGSAGSQAFGGSRPAVPLIQTLTETYGVSGHEEKVREQIKQLLPKWAKPETDAAGNLVLHLGNPQTNHKIPRIAFVAHMDEIGYQVRSIEADGRLLVDVLGGGYTEYFLGHVMLVQKADGTSVGGVLELPNGWDQPEFKWSHDPKAMDQEAHLYVGTHSAEETQKLGIKVGDWATIPKQYRPLIGTRANARSFDDRVGCVALIEAVKALGPDLHQRDVTFIWSTQEEVGLFGAAAVAERMAEEGNAPDFVFAVDTFVSSDSPIESKRFADAEIGKGFVIRAVDNSNIAPRQYVDRVVQLANDNKIHVQYGVTGGGNDGAVFVRYGSVDVPLGWPLRYSHSPAEVIDTRDLDALGKIVAVIARNW